MSALPERLREESKKLAPGERLDPEEELLAESDPDTEAAWHEEILRRVEEIKSGKVKMVPIAQVFSEIDEMLSCSGL